MGRDVRDANLGEGRGGVVLTVSFLLGASSFRSVSMHARGTKRVGYTPGPVSEDEMAFFQRYGTLFPPLSFTAPCWAWRTSGLTLALIVAEMWKKLGVVWLDQLNQVHDTGKPRISRKRDD